MVRPHAKFGDALFGAILCALLPATEHSRGQEAADRPLQMLSERTVATLERIDPGLTCHFRTADQTIAVDHKELIRFGNWRPPAQRTMFVLADGSLVRADLLELTSEKIKLGDASGIGRGLWNQAALSLSQVRAALLQPPANELARDRMLDRIAAAARRDQIWLAGGEVVVGTMAGLETQAGAGAGSEPAAFLQWKPAADKDAVSVPLAKVQAISINSAVVPTKPVGKTLALGFRDGSLLYAKSVVRDGSDLQITLACGARLTTPLKTNDDPPLEVWKLIELIQPLGGCVTFLSDLKPTSEKGVPFLTVDWPHRTDRNIFGGLLRMTRGEAALRGLGQHAAGRLIYDVPADASRFEAELALDALAEDRGSVRFRVLAETRQGEWSQSYQSETIRSGDDPRLVSVSVADARRIALLVDFAERGDAGDHANWLYARFLSSP